MITEGILDIKGPPLTPDSPKKFQEYKVDIFGGKQEEAPSLCWE